MDKVARLPAEDRAALFGETGASRGVSNPEGMRGRIKRAANANGRSMDAEVIAALLDWFPDPTAKEYLAWLHRELEALRGVVQSTRAAQDQRALASKATEQVRQKIIDSIDGKADLRPSKRKSSVCLTFMPQGARC